MTTAAGIAGRGGIAVVAMGIAFFIIEWRTVQQCCHSSSWIDAALLSLFYTFRTQHGSLLNKLEL
jgi:hypothetical protein